MVRMLGTLRGVTLPTAIRRPWSERHKQLGAIGSSAERSAGPSAERYSTVVERDRERVTSGDRVALGWAFAAAATSYWLSVFPVVRREIARLRERASAIPDPVLRELALQALEKRGNMEGAAAFATLVPRPRRRAVVRALVAFQAAYNYVDMLAEQPCEDSRGEWAAAARSAERCGRLGRAGGGHAASGLLRTSPAVRGRRVSR